VCAINLLGLPAVSISWDIDRRGMPIGLQIIGKPLAEAFILRVALLPTEVRASAL
jgi:Asp-tRNA(Asn)/Glu-tRNA(Gln) amidotransferase A subunit family amidase